MDIHHPGSPAHWSRGTGESIARRIPKQDTS